MATAQWSHKFSRPEQLRLLRGAGNARVSNRTPGAPRGLLFVSGDIHVGARFTITCADPAYEALSLTSSGISVVFNEAKRPDPPKTVPIVHAFLDEEFDVAPGIHSSLLELVTNVNFGIVHIIPTGRGAEIQGIVAHRGSSPALGLDISLLL